MAVKATKTFILLIWGSGGKRKKPSRLGSYPIVDPTNTSPYLNDTFTLRPLILCPSGNDFFSFYEGFPVKSLTKNTDLRSFI